MIPQGYRLVIQPTTGPPGRFLVIGWIDYGQTMRPVVVPLGTTTGTAFTITDPEARWVVVNDEG